MDDFLHLPLWRQRDVAEKLGTTVVTIKRWEWGYQQPSTYFQKIGNRELSE